MFFNDNHHIEKKELLIKNNRMYGKAETKRNSSKGLKITSLFFNEEGNNTYALIITACILFLQSR